MSASRPHAWRVLASVTAVAPILVGPICHAQSTILVPADQPSIQAAMRAAASGDTILVAPGVYTELVDFLGKDVELASMGGPLVTVIDGEGSGTVVTFSGGEGPGAVLEGFTVRGGDATAVPGDGSDGAGIYCSQSSPTIRGNHVVDNAGAQRGGGMYFEAASPHVIGNVIWNNTAILYGGGVAFRHSGGEFRGNTVVGNRALSAGGGGVDVEDLPGGGVAVSDSILWGNEGTPNPDLQLFTVFGTVVDYCDVGSPSAPGEGNISADPRFLAEAAGNLHLGPDSPCIDAGDPTSPADPDGTRPDLGAHPFGQGACPDPVLFCAAEPNSSGQPAILDWWGSTSVAANDLTFAARPMPAGQNGLFIYSPDEVQVPLGNGVLCLGSATLGFVVRLPFATSDGYGVMRHRLDLDAPPVPEARIDPGTTWSFQCWFRDVPAGGAGFDFSNGLRVTFCP